MVPPHDVPKLCHPAVWCQMICRIGRAVRGSLDNSSVIDSMNSLSLSGSSAAQARQGQSYSKGPSSQRSIEKRAEEAAQKR